MTVWQIAAGSNQRDYVDEFLDRGLAFVGGAKQMATLSMVKPGDLLVLKRGLSKVEAIGEVVERDGKHHGRGDKHWLRDFDGWDLEAYVYVDWRRPAQEIEPAGLRMGTIARVSGGRLHEDVIAAFDTAEPLPITRTDPAPTHKVDDERILSSLITHGISPRGAEELTSAFARIRRLARYYRDECDWSDVREHETRTFLVVPLLLALGWAEQQIKIELSVPKGRIDLACFGRPYRRTEGRANNSDCKLIIETKGFAQGLLFAPQQARDYANNLQSTRTIVVTNGYCYKVFSRQGDTFVDVPTSYMNLLDPRDRYPLDPDRTVGCLEVLRELLPD